MSQATLDLRGRCPESLETYRDFVFAASWAAREGVELLVLCEARHGLALEWLEVPFRAAVSESPGAAKDTVEIPPELGRLPSLGDPAGRGLADLRAWGYLSEVVFAALIRANYGEDTPDFFPSRTELSLTYDPGRLRTAESRWDRGYLDACQRFFMEELTPAETLRKVRGELPVEVRDPFDSLVSQAREECEALALLAVERGTRLTPVTELFRRLSDRYGRSFAQERLPVEALFEGFEEVSDEMSAVLGTELRALLALSGPESEGTVA